MTRRTTFRVAGSLAALGLALVLVGTLAVPHDNPPVTQTIAWDSAQTEQLARAACFDCHSNETKWPWYAFVAPSAFWVGNNVALARDAVNFSTYPNLEGREMARRIQSGEMPPAEYLLLHPEARLSEAQKAALIAGFEATLRGAETLGLHATKTDATHERP